MPKRRKTNEQLEAERKEAEFQAELKRIHWYQKNLMPTMERACQFNYEITVKDNEFRLLCRDGYEKGLGYAPLGHYFLLSLDYSRSAHSDLENLVTDLDNRQRFQDEQERIHRAKAAALSKLTEEEKELLGLEPLNMSFYD